MTEESKKPTLFLIDGSNYVYRAFYAIRQLTNSRGFPTNAIYGFVNMLMKLFRDWTPDYVVVVFDSKGPTFRSEAYEHYKSHRPAMPDSLVPQIPYIKEIVRAFSIPLLERAGWEADDIIGSITRRCEVEGVRTCIVSGDKDLMQLVSDDIVMIDTMKDKTYDLQAVKERFGVPPAQVKEILGLMGDASDNIPGVPGIGGKTALNLIKEFGSIEGVLENIPRIKSARVREALEKHADLARLSLGLVTLKTDLDIDFNLSEAHYVGPDKGRLRDLFKEFEFSSLIQDLNIRQQSTAGAYEVVESKEQLTVVLRELGDQASFAFCLETDSDVPMLANITGMSLCGSEGRAWYVPMGHQINGQLEAGLILEKIAPLMENEKIRKHGYNLKNSMIILSRRGVRLMATGCDIMVASYVLNPSKRSHVLNEIARDHLNIEIASMADLTGTGARKAQLGIFAPVKVMAYSCPRADIILRLAAILTKKIQEANLEDLYQKIEMPLVGVLAAMEERGVLVDTDLLREMSVQFETLLSSSEEKIYTLAGERFNINSPKQMQHILFEKLGLARGRKTKNGYSTDFDVLMALSREYELPAEILSYRSIAKLKSTYIDALPAMINLETGRIHTCYNQTVTATGRLSSSDPNLQNIPVRGIEGKRIRQAFIAPEDSEIVSADYSQVELRILAHLSGDRALIDIFNSGEDIHARTAADIFGIFPGMVTQDMRRQAKVINFGILYGMSPFGLAKELGISQIEAKAFIDRYFDEFQGVKAYIERVLDQARKKGYVTTLLNRRRFLPEINSTNATVRQFAERMAINTPIQGTAADLIKAAMIKLSGIFRDKRFSAGMIMQVHDELVFEVPLREKENALGIIKREMETVIELEVPLIVSIASGRNWEEAHS